jgi:hypothetical protein
LPGKPGEDGSPGPDGGPGPNGPPGQRSLLHSFFFEENFSGRRLIFSDVRNFSVLYFKKEKELDNFLSFLGDKGITPEAHIIPGPPGDPGETGPWSGSDYKYVNLQI